MENKQELTEEEKFIRSKIRIRAISENKDDGLIITCNKCGDVVAPFNNLITIERMKQLINNHQHKE